MVCCHFWLRYNALVTFHVAAIIRDTSGTVTIRKLLSATCCHATPMHQRFVARTVHTKRMFPKKDPAPRQAYSTDTLQCQTPPLRKRWSINIKRGSSAKTVPLVPPSNLCPSPLARHTLRSFVCEKMRREAGQRPLACNHRGNDVPYFFPLYVTVQVL